MASLSCVSKSWQILEEHRWTLYFQHRLLRFSLLPFVKSLFGQALQSNPCDTSHKVGAKEILSLLLRESSGEKVQTT